jgi:4-amino-4-deoxychorismate lyase
MMLVDGRPATLLSAADRGLNYGDGLFETLRVQAGTVPLLARHLARLSAGCRRLGLPCPDDAAWCADITRLLAETAGEGVLRLVLTRGDGTRGYAPPPDAQGRRIVSFHPLPTPAPRALRVGICQTRIGFSPALAGLKHLGRLEQVLAAGEVVAAGWDEGLMLDGEGRVVEATRHNLFYLRGGQLCTPPVELAGVAGVMRALVLEAQSRLGLPGGEAVLRYDELHEIEELLLCNAVAGLRPVRWLAGRELAGESILARMRQPLHEAGVTWLG